MTPDAGVDLARGHRDGRTFEYKGENPLLAFTPDRYVEKGVQSERFIGDSHLGLARASHHELSTVSYAGMRAYSKCVIQTAQYTFHSKGLLLQKQSDLKSLLAMMDPYFKL